MEYHQRWSSAEDHRGGFHGHNRAGGASWQAGHEGAGPEKSFGANIRLPWKQSANPSSARTK